MKPRLFHAALIGIAGLAAGCDTGTNTPNSNNNRNTNNTPSSTPPHNSNSTTPTPPNADNTARNKDDQNKTPLDQGQNASDVKITAEIRKAIMDDKSMSTNAQNCKIITEQGAVTLRGPVDTQAEKDSIEAKAKAVVGVTRVDNQLEVKKPA